MVVDARALAAKEVRDEGGQATTGIRLYRVNRLVATHKSPTVMPIATDTIRKPMSRECE